MNRTSIILIVALASLILGYFIWTVKKSVDEKFAIIDEARKETFDRKGDEPLFANIDTEDLEYKKTVEKAQGQLSMFEQKLKVIPETSTACVKIPVPDSDGKTAFMWLVNPVFNLDTCTAEIFEAPAAFDLKPGDKLKFIKRDIQDWYILNKEGSMEGGYSLRYMRQRLPSKKQLEFDKYIGVKVYL